MLIKCPECELQVSDKAVSCPHCGYPLKPDKQPRRSTKRKRLPNGFGQISEIKSKNLRKPFRVLVTVGKDQKTGKSICKPLKPEAYFKTYNDAYTALIEYNKNPYDITYNPTMKELYEEWYNHKFKDRGNAIWRASWKYCSLIYDAPVRTVRVKQIRNCIENASITKKDQIKYATPVTKRYIKMLLGMMFDYAIQNEMTDKNPARLIPLKEITDGEEISENGHIPFTDDELNVLWKNISPYNIADMILIQCYSGWRPRELCSLKLSDIDWDACTMTGGSKTDAGKNRIVPIHSKIHKLLKSRYNQAAEKGSEYLFNNEKHISSSRYTYFFRKLKTELGLQSNHRPHDGRVTFVTNAKKYNVDEYAIKRIVGHSISDITEKIYTHRSIEWLKTEIEKIK